MVIFGYILIFSGMALVVLEAFKESPLWGILCLIIPVAALVFVINNHERALKPALVSVVGIILTVLGSR